MSGAKPVSLTPSLRTITQLCMTNGVPRRSLIVALIVGTILNAINQGDAIMAGAGVNLVKVVLTFMVPYCVATYGAVSFQVAGLRCDKEADASPTGPASRDDADGNVRRRHDGPAGGRAMSSDPEGPSDDHRA